MNITITSITAILTVLLYVALTVHVILTRRATGISLGTGESEKLTRAVRAHGNLCEYAPLFLIILLLLELQKASHVLLIILAALFLVGRVIHAVGLGTIGRMSARVFGMTCTMIALLGAASLLLFSVLT